ncbi:LuxR C-terminal-related transcriptional regulator [Jatrophihabitans sp. YIM 134969]
MPRVTVTVRATDPLSEMGVVTALRPRPEIRVVPADPVAGHEEIASVAVVVTHAVDASTLRLLAAVRHQGTRRIVLVAAVLSDRDVLAAAEAGVVGLVRRAEATSDRIVRVVLQAAAGEGSVPSDLLGRLLGQLGQFGQVSYVGAPVPGGVGTEQRSSVRSRLAQREVDVLRLVADGYDTAQIAHRLCYSERTVKNVLHGVTTRLQLRNRSHAVAYAVREGLI